MSRREFVKSGLAVAAAPAMMSCGDSPTISLPASPRLLARPGSPTLDPPVGLSALELGSDRDGLLYVPASYSSDTATPLYVALHGAGGSADNWSNYYDRAETRGMVLLAPDSRFGTWDLLLGGFGSDVEFLNRALQHTFDRCRIDPAKIVLAGFSDGASYALSLGVSNGDLFSHLIAHSPGFFLPATPIVGTPKVYVSHGTSDPILPIGASRDDIVPDLSRRGYEVVFREFAGGHEVPAAIGEAALDWFLTLG